MVHLCTTGNNDGSTNDQDSKWFVTGFANHFLAISSAAIQSASDAILSTGRFFVVCLSSRKCLAGCLTKKNSVSDSAWFDCDQLNIENAFSYDNPLPLCALTRDEMPHNHTFGHESNLPENGSVGPTALGCMELKTSTYFASTIEQNRYNDRSGSKDSRGEGQLDRPPSSPEYPLEDFMSDKEISEEAISYESRLEEIWKPEELREAFEVYNQLSYQCFKQGFQNVTSEPRRKNSDKFEDSYPGSCKLYRHTNCCDYIDTALHPSASLDERGSLEGVCDVTETDLTDIVKALYLGGNVNDNLNCRCWMIFGKRFNGDHIINLTKELIDEYSAQCRSATESDYAIGAVRNNLVETLLFYDRWRESGLQNPLLKNSCRRGPNPTRNLSAAIASHESRKEGKLWQNFHEEEKEIVNEIAKEMFTSFIRSEIDFMCGTLQKKQNSLLKRL